MQHATLCCLTTFATFCIAHCVADAQTGTLRGTIKEAGGSTPVIGATIKVSPLDDSTRITGGYSNVRGSYVIRNLQPGTYRVTVTAVGYRPVDHEAVTIASGRETSLGVEMEVLPVSRGRVIVTASRKREKVTDASASVSIVSRREIEARPSLSITDHLRALPGIAYAQPSVEQQSVELRGGNSVFSGSLLVLSDNRMTNIPSLGLNYYALFAPIDDDIEQIELVRGPSSALYGANATTGVMNVITRSPFASQGTSVTLSGGSLSTFTGAFRHAGTIGEEFGYKISGRYLRSNDFQIIDSAEQANRDTLIAHGDRPDTLKVGARDPRAEAFTVEGRADYLLGDEATLVFDAGLGDLLNGIQQTATPGVGAVQGRDWIYWFGQARLSWNDLFIQAYVNRSNAGKTYYLRTGKPVIDRSLQVVVQAQHGASIDDVERLTYGADINLIRPVSDSTIYGVNEGHTDINQYAAYLQAETKIVPDLIDLTMTLRADKHNAIDDIILSPRGALLVKPWKEGSFRLTYNRAFAPPSPLALFSDLQGSQNVFFPFPENPVQFRVRGTPPGGWHFNRDPNGRPFFHSQFLDRATPIPVDSAVTPLWPMIVNILKQQGVDLSGIPHPGTKDIGPTMALLDILNGTFHKTDGPEDISPLSESTFESVEIGYQGAVTDRLNATVDIYRQRPLDYVEMIMATPNVFLDSAQTEAYLRKFMPEEQAEQAAGGIATIPLGTVSPRETDDPTALFWANRSTKLKGEWFTGMDLGCDYQFTEEWKIAATFTITDRDLNGASRHRGTITLGYSSPALGLNGELRYRGNEGFTMNQGVYAGYVPSYHLLDLNLGYTLPWVPGMRLNVTATNILDNRHQEFIGAPYLGRFVMGTVNYQF
jgi:iron complex outermembrane receptor protein